MKAYQLVCCLFLICAKPAWGYEEISEEEEELMRQDMRSQHQSDLFEVFMEFEQRAAELEDIDEYMQRDETADLNNLLKAMADKLEAAATQSKLWPLGKFSLPEPAVGGCPPGFESGYIFQDNENSANQNEGNNTAVLKGTFDEDTKMYYCTKIRNDDGPWLLSWPAGTYCVAKFGGSCPDKFQSGHIYWDDEDTRNANKIHGTVPDGNYGKNTRIDYCCREDGYRDKEAVLPTVTPFILYPFKTNRCQSVLGMQSQLAMRIFDDQDYNNDNSCGDIHPYGSNCFRQDHALYFCYYTRAD